MASKESLAARSVRVGDCLIWQGGKKALWISNQPADGFSLHPAFKKDGEDLAQVWVGKYQGTPDGEKLGSQPGLKPLTRIDFPAMQQAARSALAGDGRDEFEAMCRSQHRNITRHDRPDPPLAWGYANSLTHDRWCGWAAAWKRVRALVADRRTNQGGEA